MIHLKRAIYALSLLFILAASLAAFLLTTTPGIYTTLSLINLFIPGHLSVEQATGRLLQRASFRKFMFQDSSLKIELTEGKIEWKLSALLHGKLPVILSGDRLLVAISGPAHHIIAPPFDLEVNQFTLNKLDVQYYTKTHHIKKPTLKALFNNKQWSIYSLKATIGQTDLALQAKGSPHTPYSLSGTLNVFSSKKNQHPLEGHMSFEGDNSLFHWQGNYNGFAKGQIRGQLHYHQQSTPKWQGEISSKNISFNSAIVPIRQLEFNSHFSGNSLLTATGTLDLTAQYMTHLLRGKVQYDRKTIKGALTLGPNKMSFSGHLPFQWQTSITIVEPQLIHPKLIGLETTIRANAQIQSAQKGDLKLSIGPGRYQLHEENILPPISFQGGQLTAKLSPQTLHANGAFTLDQNKVIQVDLQLPKFQLDKPKGSHQLLEASLILQINSLDFLNKLSPLIDHVQGQLQMNLRAKGSITEPNLKGELKLSHASLTIPKSGLTFHPIQATLKSSNNQWQIEGSILSQSKALTLKGEGRFYPKTEGQLTLQGQNIPMIKTNDYNLLISPNLKLQMKPNTFEITGDILIPQAQLKPRSFSNTVSLSEDVVFVQPKSTSVSNPFNIATDVNIHMGKEVLLDVKGLKGYLDGSVQIKQLPHRPMTALGELTMRKGTYRAYGQDLTINQGQLTFSGPLSESPGIHLRAIRSFNKSGDSNTINADQLLDFSASNLDSMDVGNQTTVGVEMTGRLNAHKIKLFSIPSTLSQADILSMLLLGKPANQASKAGGQLLLAAISSMNLDSGTKGLQLLEQLKQSLGVDINLQNNIQYNQMANHGNDNTALMVGKSLSKRIYISYNVNLVQQDSQVFTLKYLLNQFFSIQITASDIGNGIDLLYTRSKK